MNFTWIFFFSIIRKTLEYTTLAYGGLQGRLVYSKVHFPAPWSTRMCPTDTWNGNWRSPRFCKRAMSHFRTHSGGFSWKYFQDFSWTYAGGFSWAYARWFSWTYFEGVLGITLKPFSHTIWRLFTAVFWRFWSILRLWSVLRFYGPEGSEVFWRVLRCSEEFWSVLRLCSVFQAFWGVDLSVQKKEMHKFDKSRYCLRFRQ